MNPEPNETKLGISQNQAGALAYLLGWVSGIFFLLVEKDNPYVRFHAVQSIVVFVSFTIVSFIAGFIPVIGGILGLLILLVGVALWIFLMYQAATGNLYKLPYAGKYAEDQLN